MIDINKPVQTRDGRKVEIKDQNLTGEYPILGVITNEIGSRSYETWTLGGKHFSDDSKPHESDLINAPERVERWVNVYAPQNARAVSQVDSLAEARACAARDVTGFIRITYEDGKPVAVALEDCK